MCLYCAQKVGIITTLAVHSTEKLCFNFFARVNTCFRAILLTYVVDSQLRVGVHHAGGRIDFVVVLLLLGGDGGGQVGGQMLLEQIVMVGRGGREHSRIVHVGLRTVSYIQTNSYLTSYV